MRARPRAGAALWTAVVGNTILALPAPVGFVFALAVGGEHGLFGVGDDRLLLLIAGPIVLGLVLVGGYWWAALRGGPGSGPWPRVFWAVSLLYNLFAVGTWGTLFSRNPGVGFLLPLAWTAFMGAVSVLRLVRPEGVSAGPPELAPLAAPPLP